MVQITTAVSVLLAIAAIAPVLALPVDIEQSLGYHKRHVDSEGREMEEEDLEPRCLKFRYSKTRYQQPQHPTVPLARYYTGPRLPPPGYPPPEDNPPPPYSEAPPPPYQASGYHSGTPHPPSPGYNPPPADHPPADHPPAYPGPGPHTGAPTRRHNA